MGSIVVNYINVVYNNFYDVNVTYFLVLLKIINFKSFNLNEVFVILLNLSRYHNLVSGKVI